jgi:CheY-like chemotaxis protein
METTKPTTLVLADDHAILREGIVDLCRSRPDLKIVGQGSHGDEALEMILELKPDFAVMDLNMPKVGGLDVIRRDSGIIHEWRQRICTEKRTRRAPVRRNRTHPGWRSIPDAFATA